MLLDLLGINKVIKQIRCRLQKLENNSNSNEGDFIPLSGTTEGKPVTGNILFTKPEEDLANILIWKDEQYYIELGDIDGSNKVSLVSNGSISADNIRIGNATNGGIESLVDFSNIDPTNKLIYAQRSYVDAQRPYKVYTALLTQSGTDAPVATVLENTLVNIVLTRNGPGQYQSQILGFPLNKVWVYLKSSVPEAKETNIIYTGGRIFIQTYTLNASHSISSVDNKLNNTPLEIRVYN